MRNLRKNKAYISYIMMGFRRGIGGQLISINSSVLSTSQSYICTCFFLILLQSTSHSVCSALICPVPLPCFCASSLPSTTPSSLRLAPAAPSSRLRAFSAGFTTSVGYGESRSASTSVSSVHLTRSLLGSRRALSSEITCSSFLCRRQNE